MVIMVKFDMHCHTKEGSVDASVPIGQYIENLIEQGYQGMLVSDHNSYNGYRSYLTDQISLTNHFTVLKGIEYDTLDAGHILVIMPENTKLRILEYRGLKVKYLIQIVHRFGGILGPAHPCGERHLSFTRTHAYKKNPDIMNQFDFLEGYNSCESTFSNESALSLAQKYNLPTFGGSDSHKLDCIGTAYTLFEEEIHSESDLIACIKNKSSVSCGGGFYSGTVKQKIGFMNHFLVESFWFYNRFASLFCHRKRTLAFQKIA